MNDRRERRNPIREPEALKQMGNPSTYTRPMKPRKTRWGGSKRRIGWLAGVIGAGLAGSWVWSGVASGAQAAPQADDPATRARRVAERLATFGGEKAVTAPSRDSTLGFPFPAEVYEIRVIGGQQVQRGELLVRARDFEAIAEVEELEILADSDAEIREAQSRLDLAELELEKVRVVRDQGAGNPQEYDRARLAKENLAAALDRTKRDQSLRRTRLAAKRAQLERHRITAPFEGRVDIVLVDLGEVMQESEPVVRLIDTDPVRIDVPTPTQLTIDLGTKPGDPAWVVLGLDGEPAVYPARVVEVSDAADAASGTRRVRVELANPGNRWPAGLTSWVRFAPPTGEWAGRVVADWPMPESERPGTAGAGAGPVADPRAGAGRERGGDAR